MRLKWALRHLRAAVVLGRLELSAGMRQHTPRRVAMMQLRLNDTTDRADFTTLESGETLYVHLNSGRVITVSPATAVRVNNSTVEALNGEAVVATFARDDVYFATDEEMEPPSLG